MGYRQPDNTDEADHEALRTHVGFEDQFEQGPYGLLFYRNGVGHPVAVTYREFTEACERWERRRWLVDGGYGIFVVALTGLSVPRFGLDRMVESPLFPAGIIACFIGLTVVRRIHFNQVTANFRGRFPAGPPRTQWMRIAVKADQVSWKTLGSALFSLIFLTGGRLWASLDGSLDRALVLLELFLGSGILLVGGAKIRLWLDRRR